MKQLTIMVDGVSCTGCATDIETVLGNVDGISSTKVDFAAGAVSIDYDPDEIIERQIVDVLKRLGLKIEKSSMHL